MILRAFAHPNFAQKASSFAAILFILCISTCTRVSGTFGRTKMTKSRANAANSAQRAACAVSYIDCMRLIFLSDASGIYGSCAGCDNYLLVVCDV